MGKLFGEKLRSHRMAKGLSGNRLSQLSGISQSNLNAIELGKRPASQANMEALAAVPELNLALSHLQAWADADRLGEEGVQRVKEFIIEARPETERAMDRYPSIAARLDELERELFAGGDAPKKALSKKRRAELQREYQELVEQMRTISDRLRRFQAAMEKMDPTFSDPK